LISFEKANVYSILACAGVAQRVERLVVSK